MVRQFNSWNGPVKAKFAYPYTNGCCHLQNTLLVKLCTLWDGGATARNSLENRFPEYLAVMFSRCVGCQKGQQIFVPSGHFLILGRAKNHRGLSLVNKVGWSIFVMDFLDQMKCEADVSCHVSRFEAPFLRKIFSFPNLNLQSVALFPCSYSIPLLLLSHLIFDLSIPRFVLCPHLHLSSEFLAAHFLVVLHIFSPFLEPLVPFKNTRFLYSIFTIRHY